MVVGFYPHNNKDISLPRFERFRQHADKQGVDILFTVCNFVCLFVRLRISPPRIKLAASNFAGRFFGVLGRESHILGNFAPQKPKIGRIGERVKDDECSS